MRLLAGYAWPVRVAAVLASTMLISSNVPAYAEPNKQILDRAEAYKEPALKLLEVLVNTDSGSGDDKGLNAVAEGFRHLGYKDDHDLNAAEWIVYDALYAYCQVMVQQGRPNGAFQA